MCEVQLIPGTGIMYAKILLGLQPTSLLKPPTTKVKPTVKVEIINTPVASTFNDFRSENYRGDQ